MSLIVDATDLTWKKVVRYTMPDNEVAEIDVSTLAVLRLKFQISPRHQLFAAPESCRAGNRPGATSRHRFCTECAVAYVAAFGSDRIAKLNPDGTVAARIELAAAGANPRNKCGPRPGALYLEREALRPEPHLEHHQCRRYYHGGGNG